MTEKADIFSRSMEWVDKKFSQALEDLGNIFYSSFNYPIINFALPIFFSRTTLASSKESLKTSSAIGVIVGSAALLNDILKEKNIVADYKMLYATQAISYIYPAAIITNNAANAAASILASFTVAKIIANGYTKHLIAPLIGLCSAYATSMVPYGNKYIASGIGFGAAVTLGNTLFERLLPIKEIKDTYKLVTDYVEPSAINEKLEVLAIITINTQLALGYTGIRYLKQSQSKNNALLTVGEQITILQFIGTVKTFLITASLPYLLRRTLIDNINKYHFHNFAYFVKNEFRINKTFSDNNFAIISKSNYSIDSYTNALYNPLDKSYRIIEESVFSLSKISLFPAIVVKHPRFVLTILPISIFIDLAKSMIEAKITRKIEELAIDKEHLSSKRNAIELHDSKNSGLIEKNDAVDFTKQRWQQLCDTLQKNNMQSLLLTTVNEYIQWFYWSDILYSSIECVVAKLLETKNIEITDVWVYSRVIEDAIGILLIRSRNSAQLASIRADLSRLENLRDLLKKNIDGQKFLCKKKPYAKSLSIEEIEFSRGNDEKSVKVAIQNLSLDMGKIYAVTGANGAGKSSFFGIFNYCINGKLDSSYNVTKTASIFLPSQNLVEVTQVFYCPLYIKPIEWILQKSTISLSANQLQQYEAKIENLAAEFRFYGSEAKTHLKDQLHEEKENWYNDLSGGQKSKIEFIKKVFLHEKCPDILLIDEAFSQLDPESKEIIQKKLKTFCADSLVLVIYHADAGSTCIPAGFYDDNLHFSNGTASLIGTCSVENIH